MRDAVPPNGNGLRGWGRSAPGRGGVPRYGTLGTETDTGGGTGGTSRSSGVTLLPSGIGTGQLSGVRPAWRAAAKRRNESGLIATRVGRGRSATQGARIVAGGSTMVAAGSGA